MGFNCHIYLTFVHIIILIFIKSRVTLIHNSYFSRNEFFFLRLFHCHYWYYKTFFSVLVYFITWVIHKYIIWWCCWNHLYLIKKKSNCVCILQWIVKWTKVIKIEVIFFYIFLGLEKRHIVWVIHVCLSRRHLTIEFFFVTNKLFK